MLFEHIVMGSISVFCRRGNIRFLYQNPVFTQCLTRIHLTTLTALICTHINSQIHCDSGSNSLELIHFKQYMQKNIIRGDTVLMNKSINH